MPGNLFPWSWLYCTDYQCGHARAIPFVPWMIRWGVGQPIDLIRRNFYCSRCGKRGVTFGSPNTLQGTDLIEPFPAQPVRIGGKRRDGESSLGADARNRSEYLARYPSGDALGQFRDPPSGARGCGKFTAMASWAKTVTLPESGNDD